MANQTTVVSTDEQKIGFSINPVTDSGAPAPIENLTITVTAGDCTYEYDASTNKGYLISGTANIINTILFSADADMGTGVTTLEMEVQYVVTPAQATSFGLSFGAPELKA